MIENNSQVFNLLLRSMRTKLNTQFTKNKYFQMFIIRFWFCNPTRIVDNCKQNWTLYIIITLFTNSVV